MHIHILAFPREHSVEQHFQVYVHPNADNFLLHKKWGRIIFVLFYVGFFLCFLFIRLLSLTAGFRNEQ